MLGRPLHLFLSFLVSLLLCHDACASIPPFPFDWYHGTPVFPPSVPAIRHQCSADLSGQLNGKWSGGKYTCWPFTFVVEENSYCNFQPDSLFVYATLNVKDTWTLYLQAGHLGDNLYDTTITFQYNRDAFQPRSVGCIRRGDGVAVTMYSYK
jgi:hypothetical protein